jgi:anaerobic ribonucleoside-triphosphate reductase
MFENDSINQAQGAIQSVLTERLKTGTYSIKEEDINRKVNQILKIHGLRREDFNFIKNIEVLLEEKLNDVSIDDNSNKNEKTVKGLLKETSASVDKIVGYRYLYRTMVELYGKEEAKRLSGLMYDFSLGLSDSTNILIPYCWSLDASKLVIEGRPFGQLHSKPAKRLSSYISALCETIHQLSNHVAGAIAVGSFFLDVSHLLLKNDCNPYDKDIRKMIENEFQQFIHSVNHLSRNGIESPFTNLSVFDKPKLKALLEDYRWYFEPWISEKGDDYIVEYIKVVQNIFLDLFDKGDPTKNGLPYRFPICTVNISKNGVIKDQDFLDSICKRDIYRYNIFVSEGTKVASCCRLINDTEMLELASQSNSFGGGSSISLGSHRVCTINLNRIALETENFNDEVFLYLLDSRIEDAAKILSAHKTLLKSMTKRGLEPFIQNHWLRLDRMFSTFGILGLYESEITLKKCDSVVDFKEEVLKFINQKVKTYSEKYGIIGNIEQVPGESFSVRLSKTDKILFGEEKVPYELYSNQFVPLWEKMSIWDRMKMDGKYNKLITGGGIVHITIGEKVTSLQAKKIIEFAINSGCEHFALNSIYTMFEDGSVLFGKHKLNPITNSPAKDYYTRVVGFFTPVSSWNKTRREFEFQKRYIEIIKE